VRGPVLSKLTYANVMATIAVFIALGGSAYAVAIAPKNSVVSRSIENDQVKSADIKDNSLTGTDINESTLGPVPALQAAEPWHEVGAAGQPAFQNGYSNSGAGFETAAFYKDREGVVHLKGNVTGAAATIFYLPAGDRPASGKELDFPVECNCTVTDSNSPTPDEVNVPTGRLQIFGDVGAPALNGAVNMTGISSAVSLNGITFRAAG
jgi:hypothetical protein